VRRCGAGFAGQLKEKDGDLGQLVSTRGSEDRGGELGRALHGEEERKGERKALTGGALRSVGEKRERKGGVQ
jgi:hypothetical protein